MKKLTAVVLMLLLLTTACLAEDIRKQPDGWFFVGYTYGGITFPVPDDVQFYELSAQDMADGMIMLCYNQDFTLQLKCFTPDMITWEEFRDIMLGEDTAEVSYLDENETILHARNTAPSANSELISISMNGTDGNMYKISIFTGFDGDFAPDAKVWEIAQTIAEYTDYMYFSEWPLPEETDPAAD